MLEKEAPLTRPTPLHVLWGAPWHQIVLVLASGSCCSCSGPLFIVLVVVPLARVRKHRNAEHHKLAFTLLSSCQFLPSAMAYELWTICPSLGADVLVPLIHAAEHDAWSHRLMLSWTSCM